MMAPSMLPYHEFGKMEENSKTRTKQESTKRNRVLEGLVFWRTLQQHSEKWTYQIKDFKRKNVTFLSIFLTFASYPPI